MPSRTGGAQRPRAIAAPSAGVGLLRMNATPLQTIKSLLVQAISLDCLAFSRAGPGVIVLQLSSCAL